MSVSVTATAATYHGNNSTVTGYAVTFPYFEPEHVKVKKTSPFGVATALAGGGVDFTLIEVGAGAPYVKTTVAVPTGWRVSIYRETPITQPLSLPTGGAFEAEAVERALDRGVYQTQERLTALNGTLRVADPAASVAPIEVVGSTLIGFDALGATKAYTPAEARDLLNGLAGINTGNTKTWEDDTARLAVSPDFIGQIGSQRDDGSFWQAYDLGGSYWRRFYNFKAWDDDAARDTTDPDGPDQIGLQRSDNSLWISYISLDPGSKWKPIKQALREFADQDAVDAGIPNFVNELAFNAETDKLLRATGTNSGDWSEVGAAGGATTGIGRIFGLLGEGLPIAPDLWLQTDAGTEYNSSLGIWTATAGANATQSTSGKRPSAITTVSALYGRNAVPFGSGKNLTFSSAPTWRTAFFVVTRTSGTGVGILGGNDIGGGVYGMPNPGLFLSTKDSGISGVGGPRWSFGGNTYNPLSSLWLNRPHVVAFQWRPILTDTQISGLGNKRLLLATWINGQRVAFTLSFTSGTSIPASLQLTHIGTTSGLLSQDTTYYLDGSISEIILYDRNLTHAEVFAGTRHLMAKYGIVEAPQNPQILAVGDSISSGSNGPSWVNSLWAKRYAADSPFDPIGKIMEAVGGRTAVLSIANLALYTPLVLPGQIVSVFIGTNDLEAGRTVDQLKADTRTLCDAYANAGGRVVVCTMLPRTGAGASWTETKRGQFNDWLRLTWQELGVALVDFAADSRFASWSSTYFGDGAHPNQTGADALAEIFVAAVPL